MEGRLKTFAQYVTNKVDTVRLKQHFQFKVQLSGVPYLLF